MTDSEADWRVSVVLPIKRRLCYYGERALARNEQTSASVGRVTTRLYLFLFLASVLTD